MQFPTTLRRGNHRPLIPVKLLIDVGRYVLIDALIDTGADVSLFPQQLAEQLGFDLSNPPDGMVSAAVGGQCSYRLRDVTLELRRPPDVVRWKASVGFVDRTMSYAILGTRGFFEFFDLSYSARNRRVEIAACDPQPT